MKQQTNLKKLNIIEIEVKKLLKENKSLKRENERLNKKRKMLSSLTF